MRKLRKSVISQQKTNALHCIRKRKNKTKIIKKKTVFCRRHHKAYVCILIRANIIWFVMWSGLSADQALNFLKIFLFFSPFSKLFSIFFLSFFLIYYVSFLFFCKRVGGQSVNDPIRWGLFAFNLYNFTKFKIVLKNILSLFPKKYKMQQNQNVGEKV